MVGGHRRLIVLAIDALDGTMARSAGRSQRLGRIRGFVSDRYSELIILGALLYYFSH